jgi:hypothetical protein
MYIPHNHLPNTSEPKRLSSDGPIAAEHDNIKVGFGPRLV